jgi:hypothetical protein
MESKKIKIERDEKKRTINQSTHGMKIWAVH